MKAVYNQIIDPNTFEYKNSYKFAFPIPKNLGKDENCFIYKLYFANQSSNKKFTEEFKKQILISNDIEFSLAAALQTIDLGFNSSVSA